MTKPRLCRTLVGGIYDAALGEALWPRTLLEITAFVGGHGAALLYKHASSQTGSTVYDCGIDPHYRQLYFERYVKLDPATIRHCFAEVDEPMATADLVPYNEFVESRFYREWAQPQGLVDFVAAVLDKSATSAALFGVFRHKRQGVADDEMRHRMRLIVPHIRRAVLVGRLIDLKSFEAAALSDTLDAVNAGVFLVDAEQRLIHANSAGRLIIDEGNLLHAPAGRLTVSDAAADGLLADATSTAMIGDLAIGAKGIAVSLGKRDGTPFVAHVLPLAAGARRAAVPHAAVAAIFVRRAEIATPSPPEVIARTYSLTPTELRVLLGVVEVGGVPEVADALGIAETTVKTHLGRLYLKTDTRRQADLVKLVAGFSSPLAG